MTESNNLIISNSSESRSKNSITAKRRDYPLPPVINVCLNRYPFCIVWCPIPLLSWIFPFIGHVGICDSEGRIYDFQGDFAIATDHMLFGNPVKYWDISETYVPSFYAARKQLCILNEGKIEDEISAYDTAISRAKDKFTRSQRYNFFTNNCHSFVSACLSKESVRPGKDNMLKICMGMLLHGKYVSWSAWARVLVPWMLLIGLIISLIVLF